MNQWLTKPTLVIYSTWITLSSSVILYNKYLLDQKESRFRKFLHFTFHPLGFRDIVAD